MNFKFMKQRHCRKLVELIPLKKATIYFSLLICFRGNGTIVNLQQIFKWRVTQNYWEQMVTWDLYLEDRIPVSKPQILSSLQPPGLQTSILLIYCFHISQTYRKRGGLVLKIVEQLRTRQCWNDCRLLLIIQRNFVFWVLSNNGNLGIPFRGSFQIFLLILTIN